MGALALAVVCAAVLGFTTRRVELNLGPGRGLLRH